MKLIIIFLMTTLLACSKSKNNDGQSYDGNLVALFTKFYEGSGNNLSQKCDVDLKDVRYEIANQLEKRRHEIQALKSSNFQSGNDKYKSLTFGSIQFDDNRDLKATNRNWKEERFDSWFEIIKSYRLIKDSTTDRYWIWLDRVVRNVSASDEDRILYWERFNVRHSESAVYEIRRNNNHRADKNSSTLHVNLDLNIFAPHERNFAEVIENFWSQYGLKIKIDTLKNPDFSFFRFISVPAESRASVYYNAQKVIFASYMGIKTIIHEFGHVLGLRDEYYTIWNERSCEYSVQYNESNIMSVSGSGEVLEKHIKVIKESYFK